MEEKTAAEWDRPVEQNERLELEASPFILPQPGDCETKYVPRLLSAILQSKLHADISSKTTDEVVTFLEAQIQDKGAIVLAIPRKSCIWKDLVVKALMKNWSHGYVDIDMMRDCH